VTPEEYQRKIRILERSLKASRESARVCDERAKERLKKIRALEKELKTVTKGPCKRCPYS